VMTKSTLKALWFGGGGLLATWLAVTPQENVPATAPASGVERPTTSNEPRADDLNAQTDRLRDRTTPDTLRPSTRNPFRFSSPKPQTPNKPPTIPEPAIANAVLSLAPPPPALRLAGVTQKAGHRTAVISGESQLYLVSEGDSVAGRYIVVTVDAEAVVLRDDTGTELRLALPE
jgi:hypothetical protein